MALQQFIIYLALNLKRGDEIILPAYGYMAASNLALQMGINQFL